jgi:hypothetical protein
VFLLDNGYFDNDMYKVLMPTAWIPLISATEQNGCMQVTNESSSFHY